MKEDPQLELNTGLTDNHKQKTILTTVTRLEEQETRFEAIGLDGATAEALCLVVTLVRGRSQLKRKLRRQRKKG